MKIDTHQHFWKYSREAYPWIGKGMEILARDRLPADLNPLLDEHGIDGTIAVQARQSVEETEALLAMAEEHDFIRGVVGWVDLRSPNMEAQLERFKDRAKMVGVRHVVQDEPDARFVLREDFMRGIGKLRAYDLVYDILIFPHQLAATIELVQRFPDQVFILDHMAKPYIKDGQMSPWESDIKKLASCGNVSCKISGMVTEADWHNWTVESFRPYMDVVLEAFGTERLTIGSDWPVCTLAGEYGSVISIAAEFIAQLSDNEQKAIWEGNPGRIYGL
ncbi:MAG TPA: amidohydrolase family protein [Sedimentisphaerales bacterium]|nr:amidohydrolase family protein [Sedimentisphaerales bacterium]